MAKTNGVDILSKLMKSLSSDISMDNAFPLSVLEDPSKKFGLRHKYGSAIPTVQEAKAAAEYLGCDLDNLYFVDSSFYPYAYYKDYLYIDIMSLEAAVLQFTQVKDRIKFGHEEIKEMLENKDFSSLFVLLIDKKISFYAYQKLYDQIPDDKKYDVFIDIYTHNEYGFSKLDGNFVMDIFNHRTAEQRAEVQKRIAKFVVNGSVKIYRGEGSQSTHYRDAYSWTTDIGTAMFFANRYDSKGKVYYTIVDKNDIVDYIENRDESEVLISPSSIVIVDEVEFKTSKSILSELKKDGYWGRFNSHRKRIKPELFHNPTGVHAVSHTTRVLFHVLNLCHRLGLSLSEERVLSTAAVYHDIGRDHEDADVIHGYKGYDKMVSLNIGKMDNDEQRVQLRYIIENHCIDDENAFDNVQKYNLLDRDRAVELLMIFKDADGLDRVRLGDLDVSYLRISESKHFANLAKDILRMMP